MRVNEEIHQKALNLVKYHKAYKLAAILGISIGTLSTRLKEKNWRIDEAAIINSEHHSVTNLFITSDNP